MSHNYRIIIIIIFIFLNDLFADTEETEKDKNGNTR